MCALLAALLAVIPLRGQVSAGATKEEVIRVLGWPKSTSHSEEREILNYPECTVLMKDGRVEKLVFKTPATRLRLWNQLNTPQNPSPSSRPISAAPAEAQPPEYRSPPPQPELVNPTPARTVYEPRINPWAGFVNAFLWVAFVIFVAVIVLATALRGGSQWGQLQKDLRRKAPKTPPQPQTTAQASPPPLITPRVPKRKPDPLLDGWSLELLKEIEWHRFEHVVSAYEKALGHDAKLTDFGPDGGVDIRVFDKTTAQLIRISQCKAFDNQRVDVKLVREFYGVMMHEKVSQGGYYTTSGFTPDAVEFAQGKGLELVDGATFISKIKQLDLTGQLKLFEIATEGDYLTPTCATCGIKMTLRAEQGFWGCINFPRCRSKIYVSRVPRG